MFFFLFNGNFLGFHPNKRENKRGIFGNCYCEFSFCISKYTDFIVTFNVTLVEGNVIPVASVTQPDTVT